MDNKKSKYITVDTFINKYIINNKVKINKEGNIIKEHLNDKGRQIINDIRKKYGIR